MLALTQSQRLSWMQRPSVWIGLVAAILVTLIGMLIAEEWLASRTFHRRLQEYRNQGLLVDKPSMEAHYIATTSPEHSREWVELGNHFGERTLVEFADNAVFPYFSDAITPASALAGKSWPQGPQVRDFLQHLQPLLDRVHRVADQTQQPIWCPIHFQGWATLLPNLQESRAIPRILSLDFDEALFAKDRLRAMRDLQSMHATAEAYHADLYSISDLVYLVNRSRVDEAIFHGMQASIWHSEDLLHMRTLVGPPRDRFERWAIVQEMEMSASLESLKAGQLANVNQVGLGQWLLDLPSIRLRFLDDAMRWRNLDQATIVSLARNPAEVAKFHSHFGLLASHIISPGMEFAKAVLRTEEQRRLALTAISIKQYQLQHGTFPTSLAQLLDDPTLELSASMLQGFDNSSFGYQPADDTAWLWNIRTPNGQDSSASPSQTPILLDLPTFDSNTGLVADKEGQVITIRSTSPST